TGGQPRSRFGWPPRLRRVCCYSLSQHHRRTTRKETMASANDVTTGLLTRLSRTRASVRVTLVVERLWPLLLPLLVIASLFLSLSWLGVFRLLPDWGRLSLIAALGLGALASLYPLRFYRRPMSAEVDERIEAANLLEHAPLRTQTDNLSSASQDR